MDELEQSMESGLRHFADDHLPWIHQIERMANHRLSDRELSKLWNLSLREQFDDRIAELNGLTERVNEASRQFVEELNA